MPAKHSRDARFLWIVRATAVALIALAFAGMMGISAMTIEHELRVATPPQVAAGETLPVRALLFDNLGAIAGPRLISGKVDAELQDKAGHPVSKTMLRAGLSRSIEGELTIPALASTRLRLCVTATLDSGETVEVKLPIRVLAAPQVAIAPPPRPLRGLQQLALGPLTGNATSHASAMRHLESLISLDVGGGACVPEIPCELFVYALSPLSGVKVRGHASAELSNQRADSSPIAMTFARVTPHGPEAVVDIDAHLFVASNASDKSSHVPREPHLVHRRARLPMALGGQVAWSSTRLDADNQLRLKLLGDDTSACIVDAFVEGRWVATGTVEACDRPFALPFELPQGVVRLQIRRDPFDSSNAAVVVVHHRGPQSPDALAALSAAASSMAAPSGATANLLAEVSQRESTWNETARKKVALQLAAAQESGLYPVPASMGSLPEAEARLSAKRQRLRVLAVSALLVACMALILNIGRSGALAAAQAEEVMRLSGQTDPERRRGRKRRGLRIFVALLSLLLGFLAMAAYMLVRF